MSRVASFDGEIGRGRQKSGDDSSSSRESSPAARRPPKRNFSPTSDDGDAVIPSVEADDLTPPVERPIIRQAVAFSADPPTQVPVPTYEANVTKPKKAHFLPGQEVPLPSKPKGSTKRNKTGIKRPRRPDAYPGQTTRFRLETYDPTPTTEPPIAHGSGPYSSLYRGVAPNVPVQKQGGPSMRQDSAMSPSMVSSGMHQAGSRDPSSSGTYTREGPAISVSPTEPTSMPTSIGPPQPLAMAQQTQSSSFRDHNPSSLQNHPAQSQASSQHDSSSSPPTRPFTGHSMFVTDTSLALRERSSPGTYYRRNYDDKEFVIPKEPRTVSPSDSAPKSSFDNFSQNRNFTRPAYRVTVLIDDLRQSSDPDHQLAEVKVPLKRCDDPDDGWWADAKDIAEQLQAGPSRIDGPARAYTMRGKYKQFILRVTADNKDEIVSADIPVALDKTLELSVEMLQPPRVSARPERQRDACGSGWSDFDQRPFRSDHRMDADSIHPGSRKRRASPSFDDYDEFRGRRSPTSSGNPNKNRRRDQGWEVPFQQSGLSPSTYSGSYPPIRSNSDRGSFRRSRSRDRGRRQRSYSPAYYERPTPPRRPLTPLPPVIVGPGQPNRDDDGDDTPPPDESFIAAIDRLLREEIEMCNDFFRASASNKACDIVKQYELFARMCKNWVGKRPPGFDEFIEESHIARALEIEDWDAFITKSNETLTLLSMYGKKGRVFEDERVVAMLNDPKPPQLNADPARNLLRLLRGIDDGWTNDRSGPVLNGITPPSPNLYDKPGPKAQNHVQKPTTTPPNHLTSTSPRQHVYVHGSSSQSASQSRTENNSPVDSRYPSRGKGMFVD